MKNKIALTLTTSAALIFAVQGCTKVYQYGLLQFREPKIDKSSDIEGNLKVKGTSVFATKNNSPYFDNKHFHYSSGWKIDCQDHWSIADYKFLTVYPYSDTYRWNPTESKVSFDFRYGYPCDGLCLTAHSERKYDGSNNDPVEFEMKHVNCRIILNVRNKTNSSYVKVNDCSIYDLHFKGKVTLGTEGAVIAVDDSLCRKTNNLYKSTVRDLYVATNETESLYPEQVAVAPQEVGSAAFDFTYSDNSSTTPVKFFLSDISEVPRWEAGKTYVYTVDIFNTSAEISVSVKDWIDVNINL